MAAASRPRRSPAQSRTLARVQLAAAQLASSARFARIMDPETEGRISYSAMCGGLEAVVTSLVRDLAGREAGDAFEKALKDVYDDDTPEARAIIERAERRANNLAASRRPFPATTAGVRHG